MAGFEGRGPELLGRFAGRLGLHAPDTGWHVARDRVAEYLNTMAMIPATAARVADEVRTLARPEFGELDRGRMADHAATVAEAICSEALMLALARRMGKQTAHAVVYEVSQQAQQEGGSLRDLLGARPAIAGHLGPDELDAVFDPARHLGSSAAMVDAVVAKAERWLDPAGAGVGVGAP